MKFSTLLRGLSLFAATYVATAQDVVDSADADAVDVDVADGAVASLASCPPSATVIKTQLKAKLSSGAVITLPNEAAFSDLSVRASTPRISPGYVVVVEPVVEKDVQEIVKYANKNGLKFLTVSGGHGWPTSLNKLQGGIQINMKRMKSVSLASGGNTATIGGGIGQADLTDALFSKGKMAVTGLCECVSAIGPALGGGHSLLQGVHGFAADNLVSARVVLADGSIVTASSTQNSQLWWAIRGAGHNFGIVTSFVAKLYDATTPWTVASFQFSSSKLEAFFTAWNNIEALYPNPGALVINGVMIRNPAVDTQNPIINVQVVWMGVNEYSSKFTAAFQAVGPLYSDEVPNVPYGSIYEMMGTNLESPVCRKNENIYGLPVSTAAWKPAAMRAGFTIFSELTSDPVFATSAWLVESFGRKGVQDAEPNAVATEERDLHILHSPMLWWQGNSIANRQKAYDYGVRMQVASRGNDPKPHSYVNYAYGNETVPEVYGRDATRLAKLKSLKKTYDPKGRFNFYNPIPTV